MEFWLTVMLELSSSAKNILRIGLIGPIFIDRMIPFLYHWQQKTELGYSIGLLRDP
jgi:hypothetical protein